MLEHHLVRDSGSSIEESGKRMPPREFAQPRMVVGITRVVGGHHVVEHDRRALGPLHATRAHALEGLDREDAVVVRVGEVRRCLHHLARRHVCPAACARENFLSNSGAHPRPLPRGSVSQRQKGEVLFGSIKEISPAVRWHTC